jgi:hypothetical protein
MMALIDQCSNLFLSSYLTGDLPEATRQAAAMTSDKFSHALLARALVSAAKGERNEAEYELERLFALQSSWRYNPRGELEKVISNASILDRLTKDLTAIGTGQRR